MPRVSREDLNFEQDGFLEGTWDTWSLVLEPGDDVTVTMRSNTLDSLLIINKEDGTFVAENDDAFNGNLGLDSQIEFVADEWGVYVIETRPLFGPEFGEYTVFIDVEAAASDEINWTASGDVSVAETDEWPVTLSAGSTAELEVESDVDLVVTVLDPAGAEVAVEDVDGLRSFTAGSDGEHVILLSTIEESGPSAYELVVRSEVGS